MTSSDVEIIGGIAGACYLAVRLRTGRHRHSLFYRWYIHSPVWKLRRTLWYYTSDRHCESCGCKMALHYRSFGHRVLRHPVMDVHHRHYKTLGRERRRDISLLCHRCHFAKDAWRHR